MTMTQECTLKEMFIIKQLDKLQPNWREGADVVISTKEAIQAYIFDHYSDLLTLFDNPECITIRTIEHRLANIRTKLGITATSKKKSLMDTTPVRDRYSPPDTDSGGCGLDSSGDTTEDEPIGAAQPQDPGTCKDGVCSVPAPQTQPPTPTNQPTSENAGVAENVPKEENTYYLCYTCKKLFFGQDLTACSYCGSVKIKLVSDSPPAPITIKLIDEGVQVPFGLYYFTEDGCPYCLWEEDVQEILDDFKKLSGVDFPELQYINISKENPMPFVIQGTPTIIFCHEVTGIFISVGSECVLEWLQFLLGKDRFRELRMARDKGIVKKYVLAGKKPKELRKMGYDSELVETCMEEISLAKREKQKQPAG